MQKLLRSVIVAASVAIASSATAGELKLSIANGRATLIATDAPVSQILAEWARIGGTTVVNGERVPGPTLTIQMVDRPEREVLDAVLRSAAGYVAAQRAALVTSLSVYDRILILPTSQAPAFNPAAVATPTFTPAPRPYVVPSPEDDPVEQPHVIPPGAVPMPPGAVSPQPQPATQSTPGMPQTLPRPGMLPPPAPGAPNPYVPNSPNTRPGPGGTPQPGAVRPGGGG